eukprot:scaffold2.g7347.t1
MYVAVELLAHRWPVAAPPLSTWQQQEQQQQQQQQQQQERKASSSNVGGSGSGLVDINPPRGTRDFFPEDKRLQARGGRHAGAALWQAPGLVHVLARYGVPEASFGAVCVVVDKAEKVPREKVVAELEGLGIAPAAVAGILEALALTSVDALAGMLGPEDAAVADLRRLFGLAEAYGFADWLVFDASVVRGLAYYTGVVFEGFDRAGSLRAICGGGRYDRLLGTFGGEDQPCAGFGFGDAVIVELLKDKRLLPTLPHAVDDLVLPMEPALRPAACSVAQRLRAAGRSVDLVLEDGKRMKWAFRQAERCGAARLVLVAPDEWARGAVRVKDLASREEADVPLDALV